MHLPRLQHEAMTKSFPMSSTLPESRHLQSDVTGAKRAVSLLKSSIGRQRRATGSSTICDKMVNFDSHRDVMPMARVDCNTCKDSNGNRLKCQPKYLETRSRIFLGISKGKNIWQYKVQLIPVACDCS